MQISLRPHHLLCLKGYKGKNYSKPQTTRWGVISRVLKLYPDADILIKTSNDDLCSKCPALMKKGMICNANTVKALDDKVKDFLELTGGQIYKYNELSKKLALKMTKETHEQWCSLCVWWKKGLCHDSFPPKDGMPKAL